MTAAAWNEEKTTGRIQSDNEADTVKVKEAFNGWQTPVIFNYPFPSADCCNPSRPHTSPFLYPHLHLLPAPPSHLHIPTYLHLSFPAFSLSCLTDLHLLKPLSNKNKNVWNLQGVSAQAVSHSSPVTQLYSSPLSFCVVCPQFACTHLHPTFLLHIQVASSSRQQHLLLHCKQTCTIVYLCTAYILKINVNSYPY